MRRPARLIIVTAALCVALAGCGASHGAGHGDGGSASAPELTPAPESAPAVPDEDELADRGFACRSMPNGDAGAEEGEEPTWLDGQEHRVCLRSDGVVAASWDMVVYDDRVLAWRYVSFPLRDSDDVNRVTLSTAEALQTVWDALLPDDTAVLGPALDEWTTPEDTETWDFEGTGHVGTGGLGFMVFDAALLDLPESMSLTTQPTPAEPQLDAEAFLDAAGDAEMSCTLEEGEWPWGDDVMCTLEDVTLAVTVGEDDVVTGLSITTFGSGDAGILDDLAGVAERSGSDEFSTFVTELAAASASGERTLTWVSGVPTLIHPLDDPDGLRVDARVILELPS
ncbi:MAG: hypothetical protein ACTHZX_07575 [Microbacterium sp.]